MKFKPKQNIILKRQEDVYECLFELGQQGFRWGDDRDALDMIPATPYTGTGEIPSNLVLFLDEHKRITYGGEDWARRNRYRRFVEYVRGNLFTKPLNS